MRVYLLEAKKNTALKKAIRDARAHIKAAGTPESPAMYHDDSEAKEADATRDRSGVRWYHIYARSKGPDPSHFGSMSYYTRKGHTHVDRMDVHPRFQRKGIATKMVRELHRIHKAYGRPGKVHYGRKTADGEAFHKSNSFARNGTVE